MAKPRFGHHVTPLLKRLETQGYVKRVRGIEDERQVHIHLTDAGRELKKAIRDIPGAIYCAAGSDADRLIKLRDDLVRLRASLIEYNETWNPPIVTINHSHLDLVFTLM